MLKNYSRKDKPVLIGKKENREEEEKKKLIQDMAARYQVVCVSVTD